MVIFFQVLRCIIIIVIIIIINIIIIIIIIIIILSSSNQRLGSCGRRSRFSLKVRLMLRTAFIIVYVNRRKPF